MVTISRRAKLVGLVFLAALVIAGAYLVWLKSSDTSTYYQYDGYADMKRDSSPAAASVPEFVPPSARHIWGWYDVDFNVSALEFEFDSTDRQRLGQRFHRATGELRDRVERKVRGYDWKHALPQNGNVEAFAGEGSRAEYLVLDTAGRRAYYVSEPRREGQ